MSQIKGYILTSKFNKCNYQMNSKNESLKKIYIYRAPLIVVKTKRRKRVARKVKV